MRRITSKAVNLITVAVFSGVTAAAGIMMPAVADQEIVIKSKSVVSRESWTGSYTVDEKSYDNMTYVAMVYDDGSVEIKGQHTYNWTMTEGWHKTFDLGVVWFDDSLFQEKLDFSEKSTFLTTIENYDSKRIGYAFTLYNDTKTVSSGYLFDFTITPKTSSVNGAVIDVFGHEIKVNASAPGSTEPTTENQDDRIKELEAQVAKLREELEAAKKAVPGGTGDVNNDNAVNAKDAATILRYAAYTGTGGALSLNEWIASSESIENTSTTEPTKTRPQENFGDDIVPNDISGL